MNQCHFIGRFTNDPILKEVENITNGKKTLVLQFRLAVSRRFKKGSGEIGKQTNFFDFEAWDTGADVIAKNFKRGDAIIVHASARNNNYKDSDGKQVSKVVFRVKEFEFPSAIGVTRHGVSADFDELSEE